MKDPDASLERWRNIMRVKVYPPAAFCDPSALDEDNFMELPEDAALKDVYKNLKIPLLMRKVVICTVNSKHEKLNKKLEDQDIVSFFSPIAGG